MECVNCKKNFSSKQRLNYHTKNKICKEKKITSTICTLCKKEFSTKQRIEYHIKNKVCSKNVKQQHRCNYCQKEFSSKQRLTYHIQNNCCKEKYWYESDRFRTDYNLKDVVCYSCGGLLEYCSTEECRKEYIDKLILRKKYIDKNFQTIIDDDVFDYNIPYENREYWEDTCKRCKNIRDSDEHIFNCL